MTQKGRISKLEAWLTAKQKFYSWLKEAKLAGGFIPYMEQARTGPLLPLEWLVDDEARFLWHLVIDVNIATLRYVDANYELRSLAHVALDGVLRQVARPHNSGIFVPVCPIPEFAARVGVYLCAMFQGIWEEAFSMQAAVEEISRTHLEGEDILFADLRGEMETAVATLRETAQMCGAIAEWLNLEAAIFGQQGFSSEHPLVKAKVEKLVNFSRVQALPSTATRGQLIAAFNLVWPDFTHA